METFEVMRRDVFAKPNSLRATFRDYVDLDTSEWVVEIVDVDELPIEMGVVMGDAIHNFRSALDQMVFELAFIDSGGRKSRTTGFPCSDTPARWKNAVQKGLLKGLTRRLTLIEALQPHKGWEWPRPGTTHPFTILQQFSNDDKHRVVPAMLALSAPLRFMFPASGKNCHFAPGSALPIDMIGHVLQPSTQLLRWPIVISGPDPELGAHFDPPLTVALSNGVSVDVLRDIARLTRLALEVVGPEFNSPEAKRLEHLPRYGRIRPGGAPEGTIESVEIGYS